eukprot:TRINITY_DN20685_c0_g1_i25.p2 TRINITY_DN20685_c0_g1~~TRINITY_DN20685_c0_g1_i25.p2  ORF type:complete len:116 (-),score=4.90 TRINITY_DN20685_c0_g1_i25:315-662(-)
MVLTGILALLVQNVLALFPIEGNMEMARVVSYLFTLFLLTFHIRRMVQCFADTHERVDSFKLENAKCFSEEDRPIVQVATVPHALLSLSWTRPGTVQTLHAHSIAKQKTIPAVRE